MTGKKEERGRKDGKERVQDRGREGEDAIGGRGDGRKAF